MKYICETQVNNALPLRIPKFRVFTPINRVFAASVVAVAVSCHIPSSPQYGSRIFRSLLSAWYHLGLFVDSGSIRATLLAFHYIPSGMESTSSRFPTSHVQENYLSHISTSFSWERIYNWVASRVADPRMVQLIVSVPFHVETMCWAHIRGTSAFGMFGLSLLLCQSDTPIRRSSPY